MIEAFGRGRDGLVKVTVTKDRHGHVRAHQGEGNRIADMRLHSTTDGKVNIELEPPAAGADGAFRPTHLMERMSKAIELQEALSKNALRTTVPGNNEAKDLALETLVAEGYVDRRRDGQAQRHHHVRPYREDDDLAPSPEPRPGERCRRPRPLAGPP